MPKKQGNFLNTFLLLRRSVTKMWVELSVGQIANRKDRPVQQLFKIRVDGCHLIEFRSKSRILNAVLHKLLQSGNYPDACPLLAVSGKNGFASCAIGKPRQVAMPNAGKSVNLIYISQWIRSNLCICINIFTF